MSSKKLFKPQVIIPLECQCKAYGWRDMFICEIHLKAAKGRYYAEPV